MSKLRTFAAWVWMNFLRPITTLPISMSKVWSATVASIGVPMGAEGAAGRAAVNVNVHEVGHFAAFVPEVFEGGICDLHVEGASVPIGGMMVEVGLLPRADVDHGSLAMEGPLFALPGSVGGGADQFKQHFGGDAGGCPSVR